MEQSETLWWYAMGFQKKLNKIFLTSEKYNLMNVVDDENKFLQWHFW
jgi:hypothetical protein